MKWKNLNKQIRENLSTSYMNYIHTTIQKISTPQIKKLHLYNDNNKENKQVLKWVYLDFERNISFSWLRV